MQVPRIYQNIVSVTTFFQLSAKTVFELLISSCFSFKFISVEVAFFVVVCLMINMNKNIEKDSNQTEEKKNELESLLININESPVAFQIEEILPLLIQIFAKNGTNFFDFISSHPQSKHLSKETLSEITEMRNTIKIS